MSDCQFLIKKLSFKCFQWCFIGQNGDIEGGPLELVITCFPKCSYFFQFWCSGRILCLADDVNVLSTREEAKAGALILSGVFVKTDLGQPPLHLYGFSTQETFI